MSDKLKVSRTGAVIIFYNPDANCIEHVNRLAAVMHCVVVDNTPDARTGREVGLSPDIEYLPNGDNVGIATAINQGIEALIRSGFDTAILLDQDSEPPATLLSELPAVVEASRLAGDHVALVGPVYDDERLGGAAPFVRFRRWSLERIAPEGATPIDVDFLITSGSCINLDCWAAVGPMEDALFIDFVDLEWCIRAKHKGFRVLGVPWVHMKHSLGDEPVRIFGRPYPVHIPIRDYYLFRNSIALILRSYVPFSWKSTEIVKMPFRLAIYGMFLKPRRSHLAMALRGFRDGIRGKLGRFGS